MSLKCCSACSTLCLNFCVKDSGVTRILLEGVQQIQLSTEDGENGDLGAAAP